MDKRPPLSLRRATRFLLASDDPAIVYFTRRDLVGECVGDVRQELWPSKMAQKLFRGQQADGGFEARGGGYPPEHRRIVETFKRLRLMVQRFALDRREPRVDAAARFLFSTQSAAGDFRGMLGDQYATYYTGEFTGLLIRAGYGGDERIERAFAWLIGMRQDDGGYSIPMLTRGMGMREITRVIGAPSQPIEPDRSQPSSHRWTDMVLRAFAADPLRRASPEAHRAAEILKQGFFEPDPYFSMREPEYWIRFVHWWPSLLTALEILAELGYSAEDPAVARALAWFRKNQLETGAWRTSYWPGKSLNPKLERAESPWVTLRVARVMKRLLGRVLRQP